MIRYVRMALDSYKGVWPLSDLLGLVLYCVSAARCMLVQSQLSSWSLQTVMSVCNFTCTHFVARACNHASYGA